MSEESIRYDLLQQEAMRGVVRLALEHATSESGLPGDHHFYITFQTRFPGVVVPPRLLEQYPTEMTVVIKRHYWDLMVEEQGFSVVLSFDQHPENIQVPYAAILRFFDPEAEFVLHFSRVDAPTGQPVPDIEPEPRSASVPEGGAQVFSLDQFRKR